MLAVAGLTDVGGSDLAQPCYPCHAAANLTYRSGGLAPPREADASRPPPRRHPEGCPRGQGDAATAHRTVPVPLLERGASQPGAGSTRWPAVARAHGGDHSRRQGRRLTPDRIAAVLPGRRPARIRGRRTPGVATGHTPSHNRPTGDGRRGGQHPAGRRRLGLTPPGHGRTRPRQRAARAPGEPGCTVGAPGRPVGRRPDRRGRSPRLHPGGRRPHHLGQPMPRPQPRPAPPGRQASHGTRSRLHPYLGNARKKRRWPAVMADCSSSACSGRPRCWYAVPGGLGATNSPTTAAVGTPPAGRDSGLAAGRMVDGGGRRDAGLIGGRHRDQRRRCDYGAGRAARDAGQVRRQWLCGLSVHDLVVTDAALGPSSRWRRGAGMAYLPPGSVSSWRCARTVRWRCTSSAT